MVYLTFLSLLTTFSHTIIEVCLYLYKLLPPIKLRIIEVDGISLSDTGVK